VGDMNKEMYEKIIISIILFSLLATSFIPIAEGIVIKKTSVEVDFIKSKDKIISFVDSVEGSIHRSDESVFPSLIGDKIFGAWLHVKYNGYEDEKEIKITPRDIRGHLGNPDYRTKVQLNVDDDLEDDVEASFGLYRSSIDDGSNEVASLETAFGFEVIHNGIPDIDGEMEVWLELHINLSILKKTKNKHLFPKWFKEPKLLEIFEKLFGNIRKCFYDPPSEDYFIVRLGYRSPSGKKIPFNTEIFFAFANASIFKPTIFKHEMNPHDLVGEEELDLLFGYQAFKEGYEEPSYDVTFSISFEPAIYLITKFTPRLGKIVYYFENPTYRETKVSFSCTTLKGGDPGTSVTLILDRITEKLAARGSWISLDLDLIGDGGSFHYRASDKFDITLLVESPYFESEDGGDGYVVFKKVPKRIDISWDIDLSILSKFVSGFLNLDMSENMERILVYTPNYKEKPVIDVSNIPRRASIRGSLDWGTITGFLRTEKEGGDTNIIVNFQYGKWLVRDKLTIHDGYLDFSFNLDKNGYIGLDTSNEMFDNELTLLSNDGNDEIYISTERLHADNFMMTWSLDTSGDKPKIKNLWFSGLLRSLKNVKIDIKYKGKTATIQGSWTLGKKGSFWLQLDQRDDISYNFDLSSNEYVLTGKIVVPGNLKIDLSWNWIQGEDEYHPGYIYINKETDQPLIKLFNLYFTYNNQYGVEVTIENLCVYLNLEWWRAHNGKLYWWLDYEINGDFSLDLLWNGEWYHVWG
jgi:hypothetical protein